MARKIQAIEAKPEPLPTMDMFKELQSLVDANQLLNNENFENVNKTTDGLDGRVTELEEQIKFVS